jgi:hypothetical protein
MSVTMSGSAGATGANLRNPFLVGSLCPALYTADEGTGSTRIEFTHDENGYSLSATTGELPMTSASAGTLVRAATYNSAYTRDSLVDIPEDTEVTITTANGDEVVIRFSGEQLTLVSWTQPGPADPDDITIPRACLQRDADMTALFWVLFAGDGLFGEGVYKNATFELEADALHGEKPDGVVTSESLELELGVDEIDREGRVLVEWGLHGDDFDAWWGHLTLTSATLVTYDNNGNATRTDVLDALNATLGQQPEVDLLTADITDADLPVGEYQVHVTAHDSVPAVILGDCVPEYWQ